MKTENNISKFNSSPSENDKEIDIDYIKETLETLIPLFVVIGLLLFGLFTCSGT